MALDITLLRTRLANASTRVVVEYTEVSPPRSPRLLTLVSNLSGTNRGDEQTQYLISAALIVSGITSIIQVMQVKIPKTNIVIGTGLVSVMGTSFTFLPVARDAISQASAIDRSMHRDELIRNELISSS